jgi:hypothetical protein
MAMANAISSATWMLSRMRPQASDSAASGSGMADTAPAVAERALTGWTAASWLPSSIGTAAANHDGGGSPTPLLWPHSGFSNGASGSSWTQMPGAISFIVSMVRHSDTGRSCSLNLLPCNSNSRQ